MIQSHTHTFFFYRLLQNIEYSFLCYSRHLLIIYFECISVYFECSSIYFGEGNGTPLQYSCLENPMDGGSWWAAAHGVAKSWTRLKRLSSSSSSIYLYVSPNLLIDPSSPFPFDKHKFVFYVCESLFCK